MTIGLREIDFLKTLIAERSGNVITSNQDYLLEARLIPVAKDAGLENIDGLIAELRRQPSGRLHDRVAEAVTINETSFFRDILPFDALHTDVLPRLIQSRSSSRSLSIWSAASSSGQEAYSLAMIIQEHFGELSDWDVRILATDLSEEMVRRTRGGRYSQFEVNRGLPSWCLLKYFQRQGIHWQVNDFMRNMVTARKMNLAIPWPSIGQHDVIFLRNVLIYFDQETKIRVLNQIYHSLRPDGFLVLGGGETLITLKIPFVRESIGSTVFFRPIHP